MDKTLNQRIYETPSDIKKALYDAGKQEGVEEFYRNLFRLGACSRGVILEPADLAELKEKYNIK
ncbi:MAG: hypothetical protein J6A25_07560 [Lachnospiraceae bacterium]|nr:hypothetical protein [Lachnospiraceae bacterium]